MQIVTATPRQLKVAVQLAAMANEDHAADGGTEFTYTPTGQVYKDPGGSVWHQMHTDHSSGRTWIYYLARDAGSYRGSFMDTVLP